MCQNLRAANYLRAVQNRKIQASYSTKDGAA